MKVIENAQMFSEFAEICKESDIILIPVPCDHTDHPRLSNLTGIYVSVLNNMQKYYISMNHAEAINNFNLSEIIETIDTNNKKYVPDIKEFNHMFNLKHVHGCNTLSYYLSYTRLNDGLHVLIAAE